MRFRFISLPVKRFSHLFTPPGAELAVQRVARQIAHARTSYPCSLADSKECDGLVSINCKHHAVASPYHTRFASYLSHGERACGGTNTIPEHWRLRTFAVSAFDTKAVTVSLELIEGRDIEAAIERQLATPRVAYLHIHFAPAGRYAVRVERN